VKIGYEMSLEETGRFLVVVNSVFCVFETSDERSCLLHYDYERDKSGGYPEAHLQVAGASKLLTAWPGQPNTRELGRLHLPVSGRRYRPVLEDVIEFLIVERFAEPCDGWRTVLGCCASTGPPPSTAAANR
jgi:hypothetical protein